MFELNNGVAKIDGIRGKYDEKTVSDPSVRYGRNSVQNFFSYMQQPLAADNNATPPILDFSTKPEAQEKNIELMEKYTKENDSYLNSLPPLEYEYRYMPNIHKRGEVDTKALLGAAYEELGGKKEVSVKDLDNAFAVNESYSTAPMDINKDGKIDVGEYASSILAADVISNNGEVKGTINKQGHEAVIEFTNKANSEAAAQLYSTLYNKFGLSEAAKNFNL